MSDKSKNQVSKLKHIKSGLAINQTGRSPLWYARLWVTIAKKYVRKSTKETSSIDAIEAAIEFADTYRKNVDPSQAATKDRSFESFARKFDAFNKAKGGNAHGYSDAHKILFRERDGLYFGKYDVGKITTGEMRDFLVHLDSRREQPLANSTKAKQCMMVRQVLRLAFEDGLIDKIPDAPKLKTVDKPRVTFNEKEYKKLMTVARQCAQRGDVVRGVKMTHSHVHLFAFVVHSFLRPTEKELFGLRHVDVEIRSKPRHLVMRVHGGKTGYRLRQHWRLLYCCTVALAWCSGDQTQTHPGNLRQLIQTNMCSCQSTRTGRQRSALRDASSTTSWMCRD